MSKHSKIGIKGEQIAEDFLLKKGYSIINKNWRHGKKEIDLVVYKNNTLVIVEVKTRSGTFSGFPEEAVNARKKQHLRDAAAAYQTAFPEYVHIRHDIISIMMKDGVVTEILHFEEAFH